MRILPTVLAVLLNAVPLLGLFGLGWSPATTLVLYWCESVLGIAFVLARLVLHRALTHKRGYLRTVGGGDQKRRGRQPLDSWTFIASYLGSALVGIFVTALFYGLMVFAVFGDGRRVSPVDLGQGLVATGAIFLLGLFLDARRINERPFSWARGVVERSLQRFGLLVIALLLGGMAFAFHHRPVVFYGVFVLCKLVADVDLAFQMARGDGLSTAFARFGPWVAARLGPNAVRNVKLAEHERERTDRREERAADDDELTFEKPSSAGTKRRRARKG
jgi:hypothetical protein